MTGWVTRVSSDTAPLDDLGTKVPLSELLSELDSLVGARLGTQP